jgi:hypothetical protein
LAYVITVFASESNKNELAVTFNHNNLSVWSYSSWFLSQSINYLQKIYGIGLYCQINQRLWINGLSPAHWFIFSFNYSILHSICWNHKMETTEIMCKKFNFIFQIQRFCIQQNKKNNTRAQFRIENILLGFPSVVLFRKEDNKPSQLKYTQHSTKFKLSITFLFTISMNTMYTFYRTLSWVEAETMP